MTRMQVRFLLAGLTAGLLTVVGGKAWPMLLVHGIGPLFFVAMLAAITLTGSWAHLSHGWWRILAGMGICIGAYLLALFTFWIAGGYSPQLLGIRASMDPIDLGADVGIGLLAAALVASACVEFLAYVLTGKWSNAFLVRLVVAGVATVLVTFAVNRPAHSYWTFYGVLLPLGEGLFCAIVGAQIWGTSRQPTVPAM